MGEAAVMTKVYGNAEAFRRIYKIDEAPTQRGLAHTVKFAVEKIGRRIDEYTYVSVELFLRSSLIAPVMPVRVGTTFVEAPLQLLSIVAVRGDEPAGAMESAAPSAYDGEGGDFAEFLRVGVENARGIEDISTVDYIAANSRVLQFDPPPKIVSFGNDLREQPTKLRRVDHAPAPPPPPGIPDFISAPAPSLLDPNAVVLPLMPVSTQQPFPMFAEGTIVHIRAQTTPGKRGRLAESYTGKIATSVPGKLGYFFVERIADSRSIKRVVHSDHIEYADSSGSEALSRTGMPCALARKIVVAARKTAKAAIDGACIQVELAQREVYAANKRARTMEIKANTKIKAAQIQARKRLNATRAISRKKLNEVQAAFAIERIDRDKATTELLRARRLHVRTVASGIKQARRKIFGSKIKWQKRAMKAEVAALEAAARAEEFESNAAAASASVILSEKKKTRRRTETAVQQAVRERDAAHEVPLSRPTLLTATNL